jgi:hypothetical protein
MSGNEEGNISGFQTQRSRSQSIDIQTQTLQNNAVGVRFNPFVKVKENLVAETLVAQGAKPVSIQYEQVHSQTTNRNSNPRTRPPQVSRPNISIQPSSVPTYNAATVAGELKALTNAVILHAELTNKSILKEVEDAVAEYAVPRMKELLENMVVAKLQQQPTQSGQGRKTRRSNRKSKRKTRRSHARRT